MNLRIFLSELDRLAKTMSSSQLQAFIHENGRTLPEPLRADYLKTLESFALPCRKDKTAAKQDFDFEQEYERLCGLLHQISEGKLCLNGQSNYEYNDWYGGASDELILSDPNGIADIIREACAYVHRCVDCEEYLLGYQIAKVLVEMKICAAIDDGCDFYDTLRIDDLETYDLGYIDDSRLAIDGLYCGYLANDIENRPKALYSMIEQCEFCDVSLEHIMQHETELADIQEFLPRWISYLGMQTGKTILDGGVPF